MPSIVPVLKALPRFLRLPNLLIVLLSQAIPYWCVLRPAIARSGAMAVLTEYTFGLLAGATVLTTLAGYVINDYFDRQIDAINKPNSVVIGRLLPSQFALALYYGLQICITLISLELYLSLPGRSWWALWLFPAVSLLLYIYAWQIKCTPIMGNVLVAFLCGITPLIVLVPEERPLWLGSFYTPDQIRAATGLVWIFAFFGFMTNLVREQIKDLEDIQGDSACGCHTLAVIRGVRFARKNAGITALVCSVLIVWLIVYWQQMEERAAWRVPAGVFFLLIPMLMATLFIFRGQEKRQFTIASRWVKVAMLTGMLLLIPNWPTSVTELLAQLATFRAMWF
jgi:4-hydroxybenzoate polyprenyltransferase